MIALAFGALMAMAVAALLIWFVLSDRLLILYATLFSLQALYIAYLSGQGFDWPILSLALPVIGYTWNVVAAFMRRGRVPVRARDRRAATLLAARVPDVRLVRGDVRGAGVRQLRGPHRPRRDRRGDRQPRVPGLGGHDAGRRVPRLAARQPRCRLVPGRVGSARSAHDRDGAASAALARRRVGSCCCTTGCPRRWSLPRC